jgi:hypothetical protein
LLTVIYQYREAIFIRVFFKCEIGLIKYPRKESWSQQRNMHKLDDVLISEIDNYGNSDEVCLKKNIQLSHCKEYD